MFSKLFAKGKNQSVQLEIIKKLTDKKDLFFLPQLTRKELAQLTRFEVYLKYSKIIIPEYKDMWEILEQGMENFLRRSSALDGTRAEQLTRIASGNDSSSINTETISDNKNEKIGENKQETTE